MIYPKAESIEGQEEIAIDTVIDVSQYHYKYKFHEKISQQKISLTELPEIVPKKRVLIINKQIDKDKTDIEIEKIKKSKDAKNNGKKTKVRKQKDKKVKAKKQKDRKSKFKKQKLKQKKRRKDKKQKKQKRPIEEETTRLNQQGLDIFEQNQTEIQEKTENAQARVNGLKKQISGFFDNVPNKKNKIINLESLRRSQSSEFYLQSQIISDLSDLQNSLSPVKTKQDAKKKYKKKYLRQEKTKKSMREGQVLENIPLIETGFEFKRISIKTPKKQIKKQPKKQTSVEQQSDSKQLFTKSSKQFQSMGSLVYKEEQAIVVEEVDEETPVPAFSKNTNEQQIHKLKDSLFNLRKSYRNAQVSSLIIQEKLANDIAQEEEEFEQQIKQQEIKIKSLKSITNSQGKTSSKKKGKYKLQQPSSEISKSPKKQVDFKYKQLTPKSDIRPVGKYKKDTLTPIFKPQLEKLQIGQSKKDDEKQMGILKDSLKQLKQSYMKSVKVSISKQKTIEIESEKKEQQYEEEMKKQEEKIKLQALQEKHRQQLLNVQKQKQIQLDRKMQQEQFQQLAQKHNEMVLNAKQQFQNIEKKIIENQKKQQKKLKKELKKFNEIEKQKTVIIEPMNKSNMSSSESLILSPRMPRIQEPKFQKQKMKSPLNIQKQVSKGKERTLLVNQKNQPIKINEMKKEVIQEEQLQTKSVEVLKKSIEDEVRKQIKTILSPAQLKDGKESLPLYDQQKEKGVGDQLLSENQNRLPQLNDPTLKTGQISEFYLDWQDFMNTKKSKEKKKPKKFVKSKKLKKKEKSMVEVYLSQLNKDQQKKEIENIINKFPIKQIMKQKRKRLRKKMRDKKQSQDSLSAKKESRKRKQI